MKKKLCGILSLLAIMLCVYGCAQSDASTTNNEAATKQFLTFIYTTNENDRYTEFSNADAADENALAEAIDKYYADIEGSCNEDLLSQLTSNRIPSKYDEFYQDDPVTVDDISLNENDGKYEYTVTAHNSSGDITYSGKIGFDEKQQINYFSEGK